MDENRLKDALKAALVEVLEERHDLLRDLIEEIIEDVALTRAIAEGETTEVIERDQVFQLFESEA